jgi:hypothetical protein
MALCVFDKQRTQAQVESYTIDLFCMISMGQRGIERDRNQPLIKLGSYQMYRDGGD